MTDAERIRRAVEPDADGNTEIAGDPAEVARLLAVEVRRLRAELSATASVIHKHQPDGSPPPGGLPELAAWVLADHDRMVNESIWFAADMRREWDNQRVRADALAGRQPSAN
jgi:hypothetical protein